MGFDIVRVEVWDVWDLRVRRLEWLVSEEVGGGGREVRR